ncbi:hypothetical protein E4U09_006644 [Claviceps aff. purpurea]|uniref:Thioredoxin domain-containing protein n=1 Tax=Claviceps aff. purpurea TaxID=1967640 RepID=A0A9P7QBQ3_9HYPO|nr:hypothetical protein E4U09_006644 [Claviceps aff. purpurea]
MPISRSMTLPKSPKHVNVPNIPNGKTYIAFLSSTDPDTHQPWCPDVQVTWPHLTAAFDDSPRSPLLNIIEVGGRDEWRQPDNDYRVTWNINELPTVVRYERVNGEIVETMRLVKSGILTSSTLYDFLQ